MTESTKKEFKPRPEDVKSPDAIIRTLYEVISGPAGSRNWYRLRSLYLDGANLIRVGNRIQGDDNFRVMSVEQWIEDVEDFFKENDFYESEIMRHSDQFGNLIQAFSTYEARNNPEDKPIARGINCIQLLNRHGRWWIVNVMWDNETKDNPIPGEFLPYLW